jgi:restriction endonuclease S subunit/type I restriction-modification system DNA methylase subunit
MLIPKTYSCGICKTQPDQISHHKTHILTQKHKDKYELFELKLSKLSEEQLQDKYNTTNIKDICEQLETVIYNLNDNNDDNNINIKIDYEYSEEDKQLIMDNINSISNKEALKDKIHDIHNYLRNNGAGYGMNALKVFNILFGLKKIEEKGLVEKVGLNDKCKFSYLLEKAKNIDKTRLADEELAELIFRDVLDSISSSKIKDLLFYEIPKNMKGSVLSHLIIEINDITKIENDCNVLLSGKIYEYFIGRDESAISELGAYFTDRHIVDYILNKLNPHINDDGTISSMIDMFGGSGGFTTGYINYLNEKYKNGEINWETEINKINHFDMNEDVIKSAGLEIFCLTGTLPNMNNLRYKNSFRDEFNDTKYKYPITNPPYGGDKNKKSTAQEKRDKIKEYIKKDLINIIDEGIRIARQKQLKDIEKQEKIEKKDNNKTKVCLENCSGRIQKYAYDNKLKGSDKEACSLILLMDILEVGGTAIGVLKEGVFFNSSYKDLRKCLIEKYNVREIISVPSDQFENTSTKTSIIIFDNIEEKTSEVKFYDLVVERFTEDKFIEKNGNIFIVQNKGDISGVSDTLVSVASREEVLSNPIYSLNGKDYKKKVIVCGEGYELVRLGDVCESTNGYAFKKTDYKKSGIPLITITHIKNEKLLFNNNNYIEEDDKYKKYEIKKDDIIISLTGKKPTLCTIAINDNNEKQYLNQRCALLRDFKKINKYYFASIFKCYMQDYINKYIGNGSNQENVSLTDILDIQIPIPKSEQKIQEWVDNISKPYDEKNSKQNKIKELEEYVKNKIKDITENEECDEVDLGSVCEFIKTGKNKTPDDKKGKLYPYYGTADITGYTDHYLFDGKYILVARNGSMGNCFLVEGKIYPSDHIFVIKNIDSINIIFIYYLIKSLSKEIQHNSNGSTIKGISKENLSKIKIKIPKNKQHIKDLEPIFEEIEKLQGEVKEAETLYNNLIKELSDEAIPKTSVIKELTKENVDTFEEITEVKEENVPSIKSSVASGTSIKSLKEQCKSLGIKGYSNKKKDELIKLIENHK